MLFIYYSVTVSMTLYLPGITTTVLTGCQCHCTDVDGSDGSDELLSFLSTPLSPFAVIVCFVAAEDNSCLTLLSMKFMTPDSME